jgi:hypothetical protein
MKKQAHREFWDLQAARLAMGNAELHAKCVKLAWTVNTTTSSSHAFRYPLTDAALELLGCGRGPQHGTDVAKSTRYLLRALKRATGRPTEMVKPSDVMDFVQLSVHNPGYRFGAPRKGADEMDLAEIETRKLAWLDDKASSGK